MYPALPNVGNITLILLSVAILVKLWLFFFYRKIGNATQSSSVKASASDSLTDCIATGLVLTSALVARFFQIGIDGWAGILVAAFILFAGVKAAKETIDLLLGSPPDPDFIQDIYEISETEETAFTTSLPIFPKAPITPTFIIYSSKA